MNTRESVVVDSERLADFYLKMWAVKKLNAYQERQKKRGAYWLSRHLSNTFLIEERVNVQVNMLLSGIEKGVFSNRFIEGLFKTMSEIKDPNSTLQRLCKRMLKKIESSLFNKKGRSESEENRLRKIQQKMASYYSDQLPDTTLLPSKVSEFASQSMGLFKAGDNVKVFFQKTGGLIKSLWPVGAAFRLTQYRKDQDAISLLHIFLRETDVSEFYSENPEQRFVDAIVLTSEIIQKLSSAHLKSQLRTLQREMARDITSSRFGKTTLTAKQLDMVIVALMNAKNTHKLSTALKIRKHGIDRRFDKNAYIERITIEAKNIFSDQQRKLNQVQSQSPQQNGVDYFKEHFWIKFRNELFTNSVITTGLIQSTYGNWLSTISSTVGQAGEKIDSITKTGIPVFSALGKGIGEGISYILGKKQDNQRNHIDHCLPSFLEKETLTTLLTKKLQTRYFNLITQLEEKSLSAFIDLTVKICMKRLGEGVNRQSAVEVVEILCNELLMNNHVNQGFGIGSLRLKTSSKILKQEDDHISFQEGMNLESALSKGVITVIPENPDKPIYFVGRPGYANVKNAAVSINEAEYRALKSTYKGKLQPCHLFMSESEIVNLSHLFGKTPSEREARVNQLRKVLYCDKATSRLVPQHAETNDVKESELASVYTENHPSVFFKKESSRVCNIVNQEKNPSILSGVNL